MDFGRLKDNSLLVIPTSLKEKVLLKINEVSKLFNLKIMSLDEFREKYCFSYTTKSIYFIMRKYAFDYDFSLDIINNLYYIEDMDYPEEKLNLLAQIKKELIDQKLLIFDPIFCHNISQKNIYIYGYDYINKFDKKLLSHLNVQIIDSKINNYHHDIYELENIMDEITFVASKICELNVSGITLSKIKIINPSKEYISPIKRIFKMFNLPINIKTNYLISTKIVSQFFNLLDKNIVNTLENLKKMIDINDELGLIEYNQIVKICNKYNWCDDFTDIKDILIYEFKNELIDVPKIEDAIDFVPLKDNIFDDDEIVFLMGFNQNNYPTTFRDDEFITDDIKKYVNLETTTEKNDISYKILVDKLNKTKNVFISYKLKTPFNTYFKSPIIDDLNLNIIKPTYNIVHYSSLSDKLTLANDLDNYIKYGEVSDNLSLLFNSYSNIDYKTYDNQYKKINENDFRTYLKNHIALSYSSINNLYRCGFRYYIENILKIHVLNNKFTLFIGNLFHYLLSIMDKDDFNFDDCFELYVRENYEFDSYKEKFFINKLKQELRFIINTIKEQSSYTSFKDSLFEEVVKIDLSIDKYNITFKGIIDKIMYKKTSEGTLISIIDYKTGNPNLNLNNIIYGLDMQLCIYAYLSSQMKIFANPILVGIYLQKILNSEVNIDKTKDYLTIKKEHLKLQGYSTSNEANLKQFDNTYQDSKLIKGIKVGKNGFYAYSKIFDQAMLNSLLQIVDTNIKKARDMIINREFFVNPKKIGIDNFIGCEYCPYKEICYMKEDNIVNLKEYKKLEFLKDDVYEMD